MTKGEYRLEYKFNPNNSSKVEEIKLRAADLIDLIGAIPEPKINGDMTSEKWVNASTHLNEVKRLQALAMTAIEEGAMWAVKAATKEPMA